MSNTSTQDRGDQAGKAAENGSKNAPFGSDVQHVQHFGDNPEEVRDTEHYIAEYNTGFVDKWDDLIDWSGRFAGEGQFFNELLESYGVKSVLDVATGTGFHSVRLLEAGYDVASVDGSGEMLVKAFQNGQEHGHVLRIVQADWRWLSRDVHEKYDAIVCLGNSFTHLFSEKDRRKALAEFHSVLKHDGILILDQRNYGAMLDSGFSSSHSYYYTGEDVNAEPEYLDEGLARFRYTFPDGSHYYLNMFPLRKDYMRRLLGEVGFQRINTYGDFQETYSDEETDFFVHVAEKKYIEDGDREGTYSAAVNTARDYYNSEDADAFYFSIWGGEDIHVGLYNDPEEDIASASKRTCEQMAQQVTLSPKVRVLDVGAGYGGSARYLARAHGCSVSCLNLSEVENERNRQKNAEAGLSDLIDVVDGSFEDLPYADNEFDVIWSQDALLHSGERARALEEMVRVLKPHGQIVFTDPMAADACESSALQPILDRLSLDTMGSPGFYKRELRKLGADSVDFDDRTPQLPTHYGRVLRETKRRETELSSSADYLTPMKTGLQHWVDGGESGNLAWGIFRAQF